MKKNGQSSQDHELDISKLITIIYKEKILILIIVLLFLIIGFYQVFSQNNKTYESAITVRNAPNYLFEEYRDFLSKNFSNKETFSLSDIFNNEFKSSLLSSDNILNFFEQNNKINYFKNYIQNKNISSENHSDIELNEIINLKKENQKSLYSQYSLTFQKNFKGEQFLNDYIIFTKTATEKIFIYELNELIKNEIKIYEKNLEVAKVINLTKPFLANNVVNTGSNALFYNGTEVLSQQLIDLNNLLNQTSKIEFNYNPIYVKAKTSVPVLKNESKQLIILITFFLLGLILSFMIISIKFILKNKNK